MLHTREVAGSKPAVPIARKPLGKAETRLSLEWRIGLPRIRIVPWGQSAGNLTPGLDRITAGRGDRRVGPAPEMRVAK